MQAQTQDPSRMIARALIEARGRGLDRLGQTRWAAARVLAVRPDLNPIDLARSIEHAANEMTV
ncbi:MAG TPA: hypothetical protein VKP60_09575 [Magnetospirillaceae bacterium]|nr:hypothetical protein [Magnetospirillaceae bacterium]